jgi:hypothetical protein
MAMELTAAEATVGGVAEGLAVEATVMEEERVAESMAVVGLPEAAVAVSKAAAVMVAPRVAPQVAEMEVSVGRAVAAASRNPCQHMGCLVLC